MRQLARQAPTRAGLAARELVTLLVVLGLLLRSRIAPLLGGVLVALVCSGLGSWQRARLVEKREWIEAMTLRMNAPARPLAEALDHPGGADYRRVRASGRLDHEQTVYVEHATRVDASTGRPESGVRVVTPLLPAERPVGLLVDRGFLPAGSVERSLRRETGLREVQVEGVLMPLSVRPIDAPVEPRRRWHRVDVEGLARQIGRPLEPWLLVLGPSDTPPEEGEPAPALAPPGSRVSHLHHAITWYSIAAVALIGGIAASVRAGAGSPRSPSAGTRPAGG